MIVALLIIGLPLMLVVFGPGIYLRLIGLAVLIMLPLAWGKVINSNEVIMAPATAAVSAAASEHRSMSVADVEIRDVRFNEQKGRFDRLLVKNNGHRVLKGLRVEIGSEECATSCIPTNTAVYWIEFNVPPNSVGDRLDTLLMDGVAPPATSLLGGRIQHTWKLLAIEVQ